MDLALAATDTRPRVPPHPGAGHLARRVFAHRADLLAALVYGCLAFLSFSALSDYANAHALFPEPYGGWAFAVAVDGTVLYAFLSFKRAPWVAGVLLVSGAAATYTLQRWHAQGALHPLWVAGVVPGAMILVTFAWHRIRSAEDRPVWNPPIPDGPIRDPDPEDEDEDQDQDQPDPEPALLGPTQPAQPPAHRPRYSTTLDPAQRAEVIRRVHLNQSAAQIAREMGIWNATTGEGSKRAYTYRVLPLVREVKLGRVAHPNGSRGGS